MAPIDDIVRTLAELHQALRQGCKHLAGAFVAGVWRKLVQISLYIEHKFEQLAVMDNSAPQPFFFRAHHQVCEQADRCSLWDGTYLDPVLAKHARQQPLAPGLKAFRYVAGGDAEVAALCR